MPRPRPSAAPARPQVKIVPEYKRNFAAEGAPPMERTFATITFGNDKNVAELLVAEGLAQVPRTGQAPAPATRARIPVVHATPRGGNALTRPPGPSALAV